MAARVFSLGLLPRCPSSAPFFRYPLHSCVPSRPFLHRRLPAIAMTTAAADAPQTANEREESEFWQRVMAHQKGAAKLSVIEESRIVVDRCSSGFLSTFSQKFEGFPYVSFLDYAADKDGSLILSISSLAPHTKDLQENGRCCLLIMKDKLDRTDVLVTYMGEASEVYLKDHEQSPRLLNRAQNCFVPDYRGGSFQN